MIPTADDVAHGVSSFCEAFPIAGVQVADALCLLCMASWDSEKLLQDSSVERPIRRRARVLLWRIQAAQEEREAHEIRNAAISAGEGE